MDHSTHAHEGHSAHAQDHAGHSGHDMASNRMAVSATLHCLTGCAIGEVLGLIIGTALGLSTIATIALAVSLAFFFGYTLSTLPLLRAGLASARRSASSWPRTPCPSRLWRSSTTP